jgi:hypothetical protein
MKLKIESMPFINSTWSPDFAVDSISRSKRLEILESKGNIIVKKFTDFNLRNSIIEPSIFYVKKKGKIIYYLELHDVKLEKLLNKTTASQALVWRDRDSPFSTSIVAAVFNDFVFPKQRSVLSDSIQSVHGFNFWATQVEISIRNGRFVYVLEGESFDSGYLSMEVDRITAITDRSKLLNYTSYKTSDSDIFRFLISDKKIESRKNKK